jgi:hypothetical protein
LGINRSNRIDEEILNEDKRNIRRDHWGFIYRGHGFLYDRPVCSRPIIGSSDYLTHAYPNRLTIIAGVLVEFIGLFAIPLIAVYLLPIVRKHNQGLAVAYVVFRSIETILLVGVSICTLSLIRISQGYIDAAGAGTDLFQEIAVSIQTVSHWTFIVAVGLVFPITALILNTVLYKSQLVLRINSAWGFFGAVILFSGTVLDLFDLFSGVSESMLEAALTIPITVNEMVLALWLIIKGFNPEAIMADSVGTVPS